MIKNDIVIGFDFDGVIVNSLSVMEKVGILFQKSIILQSPFLPTKKILD